MSNATHPEPIKSPCDACAGVLDLFEPLSAGELRRCAELLEDFASYKQDADERHECEELAAGLRGSAATMCSGEADHGV